MSTADSMRFEVFTEVAAGSQVWGSRTAPYRQGEITGDRVRTTFDMSASAAALVIVMGGLDPLSAKATLIVDGDTTFITTPFFFDLFTLGGAPLEPQFEWVRQLENDWGYIDRSNFDSELEVLEMAGLYGGGSASQLISLLDVTCAVTDGGASEVRGVPTRIARAEVPAGDLLALIQVEMESFGAGAPADDQPATIDVHVDELGRVRRIEYTLTFAQKSSRSTYEHIGWQRVDFFDFGAELDIQRPQNAVDLTEQYRSLTEDESAPSSSASGVGCTPTTPVVVPSTDPAVASAPQPPDVTVHPVAVNPVVVETVAVGHGPFPPIAARGLIWVPNYDGATVSVIDPVERTVTSTIPMGASPATPVTANGQVWVPNHDDGTLSLIDPTERVVASTIVVGSGPTTPLVAHDLIWVPNTGDASMSVVDPDAQTVVDRIAVGKVPLTPFAADGLVWVPNRGDGTVSVVDPAARAVVSTIVVGAEPQTPVAANGLIWVPNRGDGTMSVIDPIVSSVESTIVVGTSPEPAVVANNLIWVPNRADGTVSVIDPITRAVVSTIAVGMSPLAATYAFGRIWVPNQSDGTVSVIDPFERDVVATLDVGTSPLTPVAADDTIWVPNLADGTVSVIGPGQPG